MSRQDRAHLRLDVQSEIGFAITSLLGFRLLPRIKQINKTRLYRPAPASQERYPTWSRR